MVRASLPCRFSRSLHAVVRCCSGASSPHVPSIVPSIRLVQNRSLARRLSRVVMLYAVDPCRSILSTSIDYTCTQHTHGERQRITPCATGLDMIPTDTAYPRPAQSVHSSPMLLNEQLRSSERASVSSPSPCRSTVRAGKGNTREYLLAAPTASRS